MPTYLRHRFRWAACQLDALSSCINVSKLREALDSRATTLDETYDRILCKIDPLYKLEALQILQWLTCSLRPLSLEEVAELVAVDIGEDKVFDLDKRPSDPDDVVDICSSLVTCVDANGDSAEADNDHDNNEVVPPKKRLVRLAHFSVKEYLVSDRIRAGSAAYFSIEERISHATIGQTSLSCLLLYDDASHTDSKGFSKYMRLAKYAAESWAKHVVKSGGNVPHAAVDLLLSKEKMKIWTDLHDLEFEILDLRQAPELPGSPLYYAVLTRLENLVHLLIEVDEGKSQQTGSNDGIKSNGQEIVDTLATSHKKGFLNVTGGRLHTPLQAAAWIGEQDIAELLLKQGADPNIYGGSEGGSALSAAAHNGHLGIAELLLNEGADICEGLSTSLDNLKELGLDDIDNNRETKPDNCAVAPQNDLDADALPRKRGRSLKYELNVESFIKPPFDVPDRRAQAQGRKTALFEAVACGNTQIVDLLLDRGTMVNIRNGEDACTALFAACYHEHKDIVGSLLSRGALVNKTNIMGCTPLTQACKSLETGSNEIVQLLLEAGADVEGADPKTGTALRAAMVRGHESIVRLLLEYEADVNKHSTLMEALRRGHTKIAKLLVENGANVNLREGFYDGLPLWLHQRLVTSCIAETLRSFFGISKLCIWPGRDMESEEKMAPWVETPLWIASAMGDTESVDLLLGNGADLAPCNPIVNMTALDIAIFEEHEEVVTLLTAPCNRRVEVLERSEDGDEVLNDSAETKTSSPRRNRAPRRQESASDATPDERSKEATEMLLDTEHEGIAYSKPVDSFQDDHADDKDQQSSPDPDLSSTPTCVPVIMNRRGNDIIAYHLSELLRKAKRESKTTTDRSWGLLEPNILDTFLRSPDLSALRLWWEQGTPLSAEAFRKDGLIPVIATPPDIDIDDLPSQIVGRISAEGEEEEGGGG